MQAIAIHGVRFYDLRHFAAAKVHRLMGDSRAVDTILAVTSIET